MTALRNLITELIQNQNLISAILSGIRNKESAYQRIEIRPLLIKGQYALQFEYQYDKKVIHSNLTAAEALEKMTHMIFEDFKQCILYSMEADYQILVSKKQKVTILKKKASKSLDSLSHNRDKQYLLQEGTPIPFLIELGVMNLEGKVLNKKYDKFKQINRFLEMVHDVLDHLPKDKKVTILDFGCGKSYLTFALYHYLKIVHQYQLEIIGLDLKEDVIQHCNDLVKKLQYEGLNFYVGDIKEYQEINEVDMVVTLHACDTATDAALEKAYRWGAKVILSVPCCQHELFKQIHSDVLTPLLQHGILKERFSSLVTDSLRAQILEILGYKTQILEFIDMEHTPKNLLIRAIKQPQKNDTTKRIQDYLEYKHFLHITPYLEKALCDVLPLELSNNSNR